ncbi:ubiquitin-related modifier 1 isoform X1 [Acanthochromis polyacanthus]|uniref:ubiquitin-related modifier 1 isoform X1 n=1 Tax=Acanthochromis polyacanthus TaxID=80966 RepID=UPI0022348E77|nr:ubiquitin-related modifier 1 isoform X1 [Acanthochromis polyacanthus]
MAAPIEIHLEFGGGAELLFNGIKEHHVTLPSQSEPWDMKQLLVWIQRNLLKERPELFVQGDSVASWNISCKTETTLCLFLLCMEDKRRSAYLQQFQPFSSISSALFAPPPPPPRPSNT